MTSIQDLLSALEVFGRAPDKASIERANSWLQDFQHSPEAWSTCNVLLLSPEAPHAAKVFAAQTFRAKVTYDLNQVDKENLLPLRDTLLSALRTYKTGPRTIIVQLSLAIAGLALQLPSWENPVQDLIDSFGRDPTTVPPLLEFLTLLPEEVASNTKIPITDAQYKIRSAQLLTDNAKTILELLSMYISATGVTAAVQAQVFNCLYSWLVAGEIGVSDFSQTPLFSYAFEALASEELFDSAVDVICQMIHETQEVDDNMPVIELIVPRIIALKSNLAVHQDDPDKIRGYARIFSEAGETYRFLLIQHTDTFFPLVEAIGECSAYPDLDIVPITFPFWMRLAQNLGKRPSISPLFVEAYKSLMTVIIKHLHFPLDTASLVGQEADDFRAFRHVMGDTLKDCCFVLRTDTCLMSAYQLITAALSRGPDVSWQEIEAPLFAMRSMGAEIDPEDNNAVPKIMDLIPQLPSHPRVRYAALLIISRYSEWINAHPSYIPYQLQYISAGFEDNDTEVIAAAGQALKYVCQDCKQHLTSFLPTLHTFLSTTGTKLAQDDRRQVYEAIAYVISAMPMNQAAESLKTFALDILAQVHAISNKASPPTKAEIESVGDGLENLEVMLHVIQGYGEDLPPACQNTCQEAWLIFDNFLANYALNYDLSERVTRVLRRGIDLFNKTAITVVPSVVSRMSIAFEATGYPSFLWIAAKIIARYGYEKNAALKSATQDIYERSTNKVAALLHVMEPQELPDMLDDYVQMLIQLAYQEPELFFTSPAFPLAFRCAMAGLSIGVGFGDLIFAAMDFFRDILNHDCLDPGAPARNPKFALYATSIRGVMENEGMQLVACLLNGLVGNFPEDTAGTVVTMFRSLVFNWSNQILTWLPPVLEQLPATRITNEAKAQFMRDVTSAINTRQFDKVKNAILAFDRASRKVRERRRTPLDSRGGQ
ncbi:ARM repeat-containing protein [Agrocybe pediades]|nr:ARM repeat-containing protein [Agrocybe pediades]